MNRLVADLSAAYRLPPGIHDGYAPLPHLVQRGTAVHLGLVYDPRAIAPLVPPGVEPAEGATGGVAFLDAPDGWGLTPYRVAWFWIDIKGLDSDTGQVCRHYVYGFAQGSDAAARYFRKSLGQVTLGVAGERATASSGPVGKDYFRARVRIAGEPVSIPETRNFLTKDNQGAPYISPVSSLADRVPCDELSLEILGENDTLKRLTPVELAWGRVNTNVSVTCGAWIPLGQIQRPKPPPERAAFLTFLTRFDRAAALVKADGRIVLINGRAERLVGNGIGVANGHLRCTTQSNQAVLNRVIAAALGSTGKATARLERPDSSVPIIVRAMPFDLDLPGPSGPDRTTLALLVFADPSLPDEGDPVPALQLLGLTPSESRTAALIGQGLGPREAAAQLGQAENSVRTTLKRVYSKLDLSKQSELAVLVSRIASIGG